MWFIVGTISCPFTNHDIKINPPKGYAWREDSTDKWIVDIDYTNTDGEGWVYGIDFGYVMQSLRQNKSSTNSHLRSVRRRRWKRIAVKLTDEANNKGVECNKKIDQKEKKKNVTDVVESKSIEKKKNVLSVFNNQRRALLTLSFGPGNLFANDRDAFTDETGERSFLNCKTLEDVLPPTGYEWALGSKWYIDQQYTSTDEFGWVYG